MKSVKKSFSSGAKTYDKVARIQPIVAARLAAKLTGKPARILEIGCGTGVLSVHLSKQFSKSELVLTDISPSMLEVCKNKLRGNAAFEVMNGEKPNVSLGHFDLIISNLAMQWFDDLSGGIRNLTKMLTPDGLLAFSTLGKDNFPEWRGLLSKYNFSSGLHSYPDVKQLQCLAGFKGLVEEEFIAEKHDSGVAFLKALKAIGAATPQASHHPLSIRELKRVLFDSAKGFSVTYHILYGFFHANYGV